MALMLPSMGVDEEPFLLHGKLQSTSRIVLRTTRRAWRCECLVDPKALRIIAET